MVFNLESIRTLVGVLAAWAGYEVLQAWPIIV
jgi:hypothetical protein